MRVEMNEMENKRKLHTIHQRVDSLKKEKNVPPPPQPNESKGRRGRRKLIKLEVKVGGRLLQALMKFRQSLGSIVKGSQRERGCGRGH